MEVAAIVHFQHFQKGKYHLYLLHGRDKKAHIQDTDHQKSDHLFVFTSDTSTVSNYHLCGFDEDLLL